eukprot:GHRR01005108.1.p1 GENE.GHRR01005108.1~~GHRR01005108.1.p1  ORF type:complete len:218 (+),score=31.07 GHRR01005108.1:988-1641(+)
MASLNQLVYVISTLELAWPTLDIGQHTKDDRSTNQQHIAQLIIGRRYGQVQPPSNLAKCASSTTCCFCHACSHETKHCNTSCKNLITFCETPSAVAKEFFRVVDGVDEGTRETFGTQCQVLQASTQQGLRMPDDVQLADMQHFLAVHKARGRLRTNVPMRPVLMRLAGAQTGTTVQLLKPCLYRNSSSAAPAIQCRLQPSTRRAFSPATKSRFIWLP